MTDDAQEKDDGQQSERHQYRDGNDTSEQLISAHFDILSDSKRTQRACIAGSSSASACRETSTHDVVATAQSAMTLSSCGQYAVLPGGKAVVTAVAVFVTRTVVSVGLPATVIVEIMVCTTCCPCAS